MQKKPMGRSNLSKLELAQQYNLAWFNRVYLGFQDRYLKFRPIARTLAFLNVGNALDIGCANGYLVKALLDQQIDAYGVDVSDELVQNSPCKERLSIANLDEECLPYASDFFSVVTAFDVLEHISDHSNILTEINRVLRKDGWLLVQVPVPAFDRGETHVFIVDKDEWIKLIQLYGFRASLSGKIIYSGAWSFSMLLEVLIRFKNGTRGRRLISTYPPFRPYNKYPDYFILFKKI